MSVKICLSYSDEAECSRIVSKLYEPGVKISKPYCKGKFTRRYITFKSPKQMVDKVEQLRYNNIEQVFAVDNLEKQYPI